jgi:hypothetical protein
VVADAPLRPTNAFQSLIIKHRKAISTFSTVLITVGGTVMCPAVSAYATGTILAYPTMKVAAAVAVMAGKWLRTAVDSATANASAQAQSNDQGAIEDANMNGHE